MRFRAVQWIRIVLAAAAGLMCGSVAARGQYTGPAVSTQSPSADAPVSAMTAQYSDAKIMPGDAISIATYGAPELSTGTHEPNGVKVGAQGEIVLPYLGTVRLAGLTPSEASLYLARQLKEKGILVEPQVSVAIMDSPTKVVTVLGEVEKPSPVPAFGQLRLMDVISACGGFTPLASHTITIRRPDDPNAITVQLGTDPKSTAQSNIPLMPGDTVIVPRVGNVYIVGQVTRPQAIPLSSNTPITVVRAISMAGGLKYGAALSRAMVVRTTPDHQRVEIRLDLKKVQNGREKDIALVSDDVLYIPTNGFKSALSSGGPQEAVYAAVSLGYIVH